MLERIEEPKKMIEIFRDRRSLYKSFYLALEDENHNVIAFKPIAKTDDIEIKNFTVFIGYKTRTMQVIIPCDYKCFYLEKTIDDNFRIVNRFSGNTYTLCFNYPRIQ